MEKKVILAIEDDPEVCTLYKFLLEREGYIFHEARSGKEALAILGLEVPDNGGGAALVPVRPDLIVLDVMLPEIDGYSLLTRIQQEPALKDVPVIVVTAKSRMSDLFKTNTSVKGFFSKPFNPKVLREKIKELTGE
jgi:CheY-like chemotaxis protein